MREYSQGDGTVRKRAGKWQGLIRYRDVYTDEDGNEVKGPWKMATKLFDVKSFPNSNRGEKTATKEFKKWRDELVAAEPERAKREELERQQQEAAERGEYVPTPRSTVSEYVDYYLTEKLPNAKNIEDSTINGYRHRAGRIDAGLGAVRLCDLKKGAVEKWRNDLVANYAATTARDTLVLLRAALNEAVADKLIDENPAAEVTVPAPEDGYPNYLDTSERKRLLEDLERTLHGAGLGNSSKAVALGIKMALLTGMREGELCGLRWRDVDFSKGVLHVRTAIGRRGNGYYEKTPKSHVRRAVPMRAFPEGEYSPLTDDLRERLADMQEQAAAVGQQLPGSVFVLGTIDGAYMQPRVLYRGWTRRVARLGLVGTEGKPTFHDLRHTFATVMAYSGAPEAALMRIMGDKDPEVIHKYYVGLNEEANAKAMDSAMAEMVSGSETAPQLPANVLPFPGKPAQTGTEG